MSDNKIVHPSRDEFLLHLFDKLWLDISSTMKIIWQSLGIILGVTLTILFANRLSTQFVPIIMVYSLVTITIVWFLAHIENASYWYNRNLVIIANIEKQFLSELDQTNIHAYFGSHRNDSKMIAHFKLQYLFFICIGLTLIIYYLIRYVMPCFIINNYTSTCKSSCNGIYIPIILAIVGAVFLFWFNRENKQKYNEFKDKSPGIKIKNLVKFNKGHSSNSFFS